MENYLMLLQKSPLFAGCSDEEIQAMATCLDARERTLAKDAFVFRAGDEPRSIYFILSGSMHIVDEDFWGNRSIIETMGRNALFGEAYALVSAEKHLVSVIAAENSTILEIDPVRLLETCLHGCPSHSEVIKNVARILSEKIVRLTEKLGHIAQRSLREKILSYLSKCARQAQSNTFYIPYSRQQLADYLCVDRSALSHELSKLCSSGMLRYRKNFFELLITESEA